MAIKSKKVKPGTRKSKKINKTTKPDHARNHFDADLSEDFFDKTSKGSGRSSWDVENEFIDMNFRLVDE